MNKITKIRNDINEYILNSIQNAVILINSKKKTIIYCNNASEDLLGLSKRKILNQNLSKIFSTDTNFLNLINKSIKNNTNFHNHDLDINLKSRSLNTSVSITKADESSYLINIYNFDTSIKIRSKFNYQKSVQSITSLISMLSHEIRNPLSGIKGAAQIIKRNDKLKQNDLKLIDLIDSEINRIKSLLDTLENFTDNRPPKKININLNQILRYVKDAVSLGFEDKNINFSEIYDPSLPPVNGNKDQLTQLFMNLMKNSCEAVKNRGGHVSIKTKYEHGNFPLSVYIEDNGTGVPGNIKENLFDAFVTSKRNGRGLGLSISAKIVELHSGLIEFDTNKDKTIFKVMFKQ